MLVVASCVPAPAQEAGLGDGVVPESVQLAIVSVASPAMLKMLRVTIPFGSTVATASPAASKKVTVVRLAVGSDDP